MKIIRLVILGITLSVFQNAYSGVKEVGNGGVAIVCREDKTNKIIQASLLDIFEAENLGHTIDRSSLPLDQQINEKLSKLQSSSGLEYELRRQIGILQNEVRFILNPKVGMPLTNDTLPRLRQKGCEYEQLATYFEDENANLESKGTLQIDKEIYDSLNPTDQAALWFHESLYKLDRRLNNSQDSRRARDLTGLFFSVDGTEKLVTIMNNLFSRFIANENTVWLDPSAELVFRFSSSVPANSQCYVYTLMGPVFVDTKPYYEEVKIPAGWNEKVFSMNGQFFVPGAECWVFDKPEGMVKLEVLQQGKKVITLLMNKLEAVNSGGNLYKSITNIVVHPGGKETQNLVWRFL